MVTKNTNPYIPPQKRKESKCNSIFSKPEGREQKKSKEKNKERKKNNEGNYKQNKKSSYWMEEDICKLYTQQELISKIQRTHTIEHQKNQTASFTNV